MQRLHHTGRAAGVLAPVILLVTALTTAFATPSYEWPTDPFSVVGATGGLTAVAFNVGLVLAGILAAVYGVHRWHTGRRGTGAIYALGGVSLAVAGVFPAGTELHEVAAVFLLTAWLPPVVDGVSRWRTGNRVTGTTGIVLGVAALGIWLPQDFDLAWAWVGYGAAELVTFATWGVWTAWVAAGTEMSGATERELSQVNQS